MMHAHHFRRDRLTGFMLRFSWSGAPAGVRWADSSPSGGLDEVDIAPGPSEQLGNSVVVIGPHAQASDFVQAGSCIETGGTDTQAVFVDPPQPPQLSFFLVRAVNTCGTGILNTTHGQRPACFPRRLRRV